LVATTSSACFLSASPRALVVALSLASNALEWFRALAKETTILSRQIH
jgi:hypothetical protein